MYPNDAVAPLSDTNPELLIFEAPGAREYRIENWRLSRVGNGKVIEGAHNFDWQDISILVALAYFKVLGLIMARLGMIICSDSRTLLAILCARSLGGTPYMA